MPVIFIFIYGICHPIIYCLLFYIGAAGSPLARLLSLDGEDLEQRMQRSGEVHMVTKEFNT
jgi:hypothetical protein